MRTIVGALVAFAFVVASTSAWAANGANLQVTAGGVNGQINAADPRAVSRTISALSGNLYLVAGSTAAAACDLAAGTLRVSSVGEGLPNTQNTPSLPGASCNLNDTITVSGPGTTVTATATLDVDGSFDVAGMAANGDGLVQINMSATLLLGNGSSAGGAANRQVQVAPNHPLTDTTDLPTPALPSTGSVNGHGITLHLEKDVMLTVGQPTSLSAQLSVNGFGSDGYTVNASFGNTARLEITLPAGYSYTSASGVLLSQDGSAGLALPPDGGAGVGAMDMGSGTTTGGTTGTTGGTTGTTGGTTGTTGGTTGTKKSSGGCTAVDDSDGESLVVMAALLMGLGLLALRRRGNSP